MRKDIKIRSRQVTWDSAAYDSVKPGVLLLVVLCSDHKISVPVYYVPVGKKKKLNQMR